jgi:hypothetical protein
MTSEEIIAEMERVTQGIVSRQERDEYECPYMIWPGELIDHMREWLKQREMKPDWRSVHKATDAVLLSNLFRPGTGKIE